MNDERQRTPADAGHHIKTDANILKKKTLQDNRENKETGEAPTLKEEVGKAVRMLKTDKSPGVDNIPAEVLKHGGQALSMP